MPGYYLRHDDGTPYTAEDFDFYAWLAEKNTEHLKTAKGRIALTKYDPLLFAVVYLSKHLRGPETGDAITFNDMHLDLFRQALLWTEKTKEPRGDRDAYIAPRESGKSTLLFLVLPMWAAAHGHVKFIAAFADSATQAENHLSSFKAETGRNERLRGDFPLLCTPKRQPGGQTVADRQNMYQTESDFVFAARGVDSSNLGLKVEDKRPDLLILDDVEPMEAKYSAGECAKRLGTICDGILPLSEFARVVLVGTVTMPNSIIHQLVQSRLDRDKAPPWIAEQKFRVNHFRPIITVDGVRRSMWPAKWKLVYLESIEHTRSYMKNFENDPRGNEGALLKPEQLINGRRFHSTAKPVKVAVAVDPSGGGRDVAGIIGGHRADDGAVYWTHDRSIAGTSDAWSERVAVLAAEINADIIFYEKNYGADLVRRSIATAWRDIHAGTKRPPPCPRIVPVHGKRGKFLRAEPISQAFISGDVWLGAMLPELEAEWSTWVNGGAESPGRIDASVYLTYGLLPIPGAEGVVSSPTGINAGAAAALGIGPQASMLGMPHR